MSRHEVDRSSNHRGPGCRKVYSCDSSVERIFRRLPRQSFAFNRLEPEPDMSRDAIRFSVLNAFRIEAESQTQALTSNLLRKLEMEYSTVEPG